MKTERQTQSLLFFTGTARTGNTSILPKRRGGPGGQALSPPYSMKSNPNSSGSFIGNNE